MYQYCKNFFKFLLGLILFIPLILLCFGCPALEILKIIFFLQTYGDLQLNLPLEIIYLFIALCGPVLLIILIMRKCCFNWCVFTHECLQQILMWLLLLWIANSLIYANFTWNELGNIPLLCPPRYDYTTLEIKQACEVRAANLFCQWIFLFIMIFWTVLLREGYISEYLDIGKKLTYYEESYDY
ncbi:hypothetical protein F8M41_009472 [Gigaspora margarita]|uniref:Uncharacterized protein n=1 Tax=Gigaspora margarita TaxID=4874 RepID=A0A8H4A3Y9_GIGMA|nr:hypothetical protein F8M41_009472 [Gigaspora margarita]